MCTPSKVPTATLARSRRSTSGRATTFTRASLVRSLGGQQRERLLEGDQRRFSPGDAARRGRDRVANVERADRGAPELQAVGVAEVGDQGAHVGAGRTLDLERGPLHGGGVVPALPPQLAEAVYGDRALGHLRALATAGAPVGALARDLDRGVDRRTLADLPRGPHRRGRRQATRLGGLAPG